MGSAASKNVIERNGRHKATSHKENTNHNDFVQQISLIPKPEPEICEEEDENAKDPRIVTILKSLESSISKLKNETKKREKQKVLTEALTDALSEIWEFYTEAPEDDKLLRHQIGRKIATSGTAKILCDIVSELNITHTQKHQDNDDDNSIQYIIAALCILVDYSDSVPEHSDIIVDHPKFLHCIGESLIELSRMENSRTEKLEEYEDVPDTSITIVHNVALVDTNVSKIRDLKFVDILVKYLNHSKEEVRFVAIATLADIVNEEESAILQKGQHTFKFLNQILKRALNAPDRHHLGWPAWELARTTRQIAKNDTNKRALVEHGCLPLLVKLADSNDALEKREAISALWTLSFDKENQNDMVSDKNIGVIDVFTSYRNSSDKEVRKACEGALWNMREELAAVEKYKDIAQELIGGTKSTELENTSGHVMISYQWANQNLIVKIRDQLRKCGYRVWVDIDDMEGSTLQAMASAVEKAETVLVCFSKKYKESDNCRAEAEYAFQKRKRIVPLKMEYGYKADGWLGIILGAKKYYDFGGKYSIESRMNELAREIKSIYEEKQHMIIPQQSLDVHHKPVVMRSEDIHASHSEVAEWSHDEVLQWLDKHSLDKKKFGHLNGKTISYLQYMYHQSPDFYNTALKDHLQIKDLFTMAAFTYALDHTSLSYKL